jgi:hypothetical protein
VPGRAEEAKESLDVARTAERVAPGMAVQGVTRDAGARTDNRQRKAEGSVADADGAAESEAAANLGLRGRSFESGDGARRARDRWEGFALRFPASPRAEEVRVAAIDAAAEAYRVDRRQADLLRLKGMVRAYLARSEAPAAEHVRQVLDEAAASRRP